MIAPTKIPVVLLVEDDSDDRLLAREAWEETGLEAELRFVENGAEMLDYLQHRGAYASAESAPRPSLVLLDLNLPRMDGREALREIRRDPALKRMPVVVFTTSRADTDIVTMYELGANSYIAKPTAFEALVRTMRQIGEYWFQMVVLPLRAA